MARPRKNPVVTQEVVKPAIIADNIEKDVQITDTTEETLLIACHLSSGIKFDDVPNESGGTKTVVFPSINDSLRGKSDGILVEAGKAVAVSVSKKDWENIIRMHGKEPVFTGRNGGVPCLIPMKNLDEFKARQTEIISEMAHGLEPITAADLDNITAV